MTWFLTALSSANRGGGGGAFASVLDDGFWMSDVMRLNKKIWTLVKYINIKNGDSHRVTIIWKYDFLDDEKIEVLCHLNAGGLTNHHKPP